MHTKRQGEHGMEELRKEFETCKAFLEKKEKQTEDMKVALQANTAFFARVKKVLQEGSPEEKREAFGFFTQILKSFLQEAQKLSGIKEGEAPLQKALDALSPEQQEMLAKVKEQMKSLEKEFMQNMQLMLQKKKD